MDQQGVAFFLRQATGLGAIRDQACIPWDDDIDLGCVIGLNGLTEDLIDPVLHGFRDQGYFVNSPPYTFFLLNGDIELNRYREPFVQKVFQELQS